MRSPGQVDENGKPSWTGPASDLYHGESADQGARTHQSAATDRGEISAAFAPSAESCVTSRSASATGNPAGAVVQSVVNSWRRKWHGRSSKKRPLRKAGGFRESQGDGRSSVQARRIGNQRGSARPECTGARTGRPRRARQAGPNFRASRKQGAFRGPDIHGEMRQFEEAEHHRQVRPTHIGSLHTALATPISSFRTSKSAPAARESRGRGMLWRIRADTGGRVYVGS